MNAIVQAVRTTRSVGGLILGLPVRILRSVIGGLGQVVGGTMGVVAKSVALLIALPVVGLVLALVLVLVSLVVGVLAVALIALVVAGPWLYFRNRRRLVRYFERWR